MAQYRQSGMDRYGVRGGGGSARNDLHNNSNGVFWDQRNFAIGGTAQLKQHRPRRSLVRSDKTNCVSVGAVIVLLSLVLVVTVVAYYFLSQDSNEINNHNAENDDMKDDLDFLTNVPRITNKVLKFGKGSVGHGRDSRYWDKDDRRRDEDYDEDVLENTRENPGNEAFHKNDAGAETNENKRSSLGESMNLVLRGSGLYNEAGRLELKKYEAEYEASLRKGGQLKEDNDIKKQLPDYMQNGNDGTDVEDDYDDNIDPHEDQTDDFDDTVQIQKPNEVKYSGDSKIHPATKDHPVFEDNEGVSSNSLDGNLLLTDKSFDGKAISRYGNLIDEQSSKTTLSESKRKSRRRRGSCDIKFLNSTSLLVEPPESRKFARFTLQYTGTQEKPIGDMQWVPRFAGHQSLEERENSFVACDQKINCGFVKGPREFPITGFDLAEDDASYISRCHIAVISCIFGNSDRLRVPASKTITRFSKKNVCFVMFMDEVTLQMLSSEGHDPDKEEFIGLWRIVVVRNLPYDDMRRVGKIPKLLSHRLFPYARYSIWLDSKLRLQLDPLLILEYFLWRKGYEYAISNHYNRHCVWDEVARNKKLNKYNHTLIDQQFSFYQADGLTRFSSSDPNKLLPSNVPEGSFIIRAHTPMSNLFSCLWFNEVDRFTPRDQLSFAYTYQKLRRMNPDKPFHLNMFKDCERRAIAKLFHHRSEERRNNYQKATE